MVMDKRAQFFLLAAVIISAVVISFGVTVNRAVVGSEPNGFYDFSHDVKRESNSVFNYEIYSGFTNNDNLTKFVNLLAGDIKGNMPKSNFIFIYGNNKNITIVNYGTKSIYAQGKKLHGANRNTLNKICLGGYCKHIINVAENFNEMAGQMHLKEPELAEKKNVSVDVGGQHLVFPISDQKQIIFIIQKDVNNESFVTIG